MKFYAIYFEKMEDGGYRRPAGDRSVVVLDGRKSLKNLVKDAIAEAGHRRPLYDAVAVYCGVNLIGHLRSVSDLLSTSTGERLEAAPTEGI